MVELARSEVLVPLLQGCFLSLESFKKNTKMSLSLLTVVFPNAKVSSTFIKHGKHPLHLSKPITCNRNSLSCSHRPKKGKIMSLNSDSINQDSKLSFLGEPAEELVESSKQKIHNAIIKQVELVDKMQLRSKEDIVFPPNMGSLSNVYDECGEMCAVKEGKTFYLGSLLLSEDKRRAVWAVYAWARRIDDFIDGPNGATIADLDKWESRLEDLFVGRPFDAIDAALSDTVAKFPIDIQLFKEMIEGMRWDLEKSRYKNFDELYLYSYYVAGTAAFMSLPILGVSPSSKASKETVYNAALASAIAAQLTNILRDVGEDAKLGRIYLPQDELKLAGLSDEDIFVGKVTDKWRKFMKKQIERARMYYNEVEKASNGFKQANRWTVLAAARMYRQILDEIEANDYDNFTKKATVSKPKKMLAILISYVESLLPR